MDTKTPRQRLQWLIDAIERRTPATEEQAWKYLNELWSFAGHDAPNGVGKFRSAKEYLVDALENCRQLVDQAAARQDIITLPRPQSQALRWNKTSRRYDREIKPATTIFENFLIGAVGDLIKECGQWLKHCEAPVRRAPGRKSASQGEQVEATCDKLFVAFKETQRFCTLQCLNRTLTRSRREKEKQTRPARRKALRRKEQSSNARFKT
jgi:hypothetical protein